MMMYGAHTQNILKLKNELKTAVDSGRHIVIEVCKFIKKLCTIFKTFSWVPSYEELFWWKKKSLLTLNIAYYIHVNRIKNSGECRYW